MRNMLEEGFKLSKISSQLGGGTRPRRLVYGKDGMGVRFEKLAFLDESKDGGGTGEYFCLLGVKFDVMGGKSGENLGPVGNCFVSSLAPYSNVIMQLRTFPAWIRSPRT